MATFTVEITPDYSNGTIAHAVGKFSGGSSSYKGQRRMDVTVSGVGTFSALSPETSGGENTFSLDITGLTPGTTYNWSASLYYKNTSGSWVTAGTQYDKSGSFTTKSGAAAHKALVNGTVYTVKGGKCMVNGTVYNILKGRTLINGTGYDITFEPDVSLTWYFNQTLSIPVSTTSTTFSTRAHYEGGSKTITGIQIINRGDNPNMSYLGSGFASTAWDQRRGWRDTAYRTITFDEAPSGDLLAWLQENATPQ